MVLAIILALMSTLPAIAADGKKEICVFDLQVGDILQPGDVITLADWQPYENVAYFDYTEDSLNFGNSGVTNHSHTAFYDALDNHRYESDRFVIKEYKQGEKALDINPERLHIDDFGGWMVMARRAETISSGNYGYLILMAVPKKMKKEVTCTSQARIVGENSVPEGAGIVLYSYDIKTGKLRKSDENGTLKVSPGDVVYAVSKPAMKY